MRIAQKHVTWQNKRRTASSTNKRIARQSIHTRFRFPPKLQTTRN